MAGLDPATKQTCVCTSLKLLICGVDTPPWVAASRAAMVTGGKHQFHTIGRGFPAFAAGRAM